MNIKCTAEEAQMLVEELIVMTSIKRDQVVTWILIRIIISGNPEH